MTLDQQGHMWASMALALAFSLYFGPVWGTVAALTAGILKELVWDGRLGRGNPDPKDMAANLVGVGLGLSIFCGSLYV
jgi:hypothetical protein